MVWGKFYLPYLQSDSHNNHTESHAIEEGFQAINKSHVVGPQEYHVRLLLLLVSRLCGPVAREGKQNRMSVCL